MSRSNEPLSATPLDYATPPPRRRRWPLVLALALLGFVLLALLVLGFGLTSITTGPRTVVIANPQTAQGLPAPPREQMQSTFVPAEGMEMTLKQRESRWLPGGSLKLGIDDITGGQVLVAVSDADGNVLLAQRSMREAGEVTFADPDGAPLRLTLLELTNHLIGDDFATFRLAPADAPATQPALSEAQKIQQLLARIAALENAVFIRNGTEHSAAEAVEHLQRKSASLAEDPDATAERFIEEAASRSSLSGRPYRIRLPDGREVESGPWLREQLKEIERNPATRPPPPGPAGEPDATPGANRDNDRRMDLSLPTLGGKQFWTDVRIDAGWRIQQHALTGVFRLLDDHDRRRASGALAECDAAWRETGPPPAPREGREVVVVLHGLGRTRGTMQPLADSLEAAGFAVANAGYASTRQPVTAHAEALSSIVAHLAGYSRVHFVGHSLGNLVVRRYLAMREQDPAAHPGPPVGRVVMLAPPNNGSMLAKRLKDNLAFRLALGPSGQEIAQWESLPAELATPRDFGVIAGQCSFMGNPLLGADGDLVVSVDETRLQGSSDFACLDATHTFLMRNPEAMHMTASFLRCGKFTPPASEAPTD